MFLFQLSCGSYQLVPYKCVSNKICVAGDAPAFNPENGTSELRLFTFLRGLLLDVEIETK